MTDSQGEKEKLRRTPLTVVAIAAMLGAFVTYLFFGTLENIGQPVPRVPSVSWVVLGVLAMSTACLAWLTNQQIQKKRRQIDPGQAVARLVISKTALLAGAAFAGGYLMIALLYLPRIAAPVPAERVVNAGICVLCAVVLSLAGWLLERACVDNDHSRSDDARGDIG